LINRQEVALLDVRDEATFAVAHPLFAASVPLGRLDAQVLDRVPRINTPVVVYDDGESLASKAVDRLVGLGYSDVSVLDGGLSGWQVAGGELFRDVNVPSKAFGELVEARRHTPSLAAEELQYKLEDLEDLVILDARRFEEYRTMSIPTATSVPGAELVYRVRELAPRPETLVVVNCAGRTRSIIGAQSLVNAGIPNRVMALRNGTIGWLLAGLELDRGQSRRFPVVSPRNQSIAAADARAVADRFAVQSIQGAVRDTALETLHLYVWVSSGEFPQEFWPGSMVDTSRPPLTVKSLPELVQQALHRGRFVAFRQLDEVETLHRIGSPEAANRDQQIQIWSNPVWHGRL